MKPACSVGFGGAQACRFFKRGCNLIFFVLRCTYSLFQRGARRVKAHGRKSPKRGGKKSKSRRNEQKDATDKPQRPQQTLGGFQFTTRG